MVCDDRANGTPSFGQTEETGEGNGYTIECTCREIKVQNVQLESSLQEIPAHVNSSAAGMVSFHSKRLEVNSYCLLDVNIMGTNSPEARLATLDPRDSLGALPCIRCVFFVAESTRLSGPAERYWNFFSFRQDAAPFPRLVVNVVTSKCKQVRACTRPERSSCKFLRLALPVEKVPALSKLSLGQRRRPHASLDQATCIGACAANSNTRSLEGTM